MQNILDGLSWAIFHTRSKTLGRLCDGIAVLFYSVLRMRRSLIQENIRTALGESLTDAEVGRVAKASISSLFLTACELLESKHTILADSVVVKNSQIIQDALKQGRGCYILCTHTANWEALAAAVCQRFGPSYVPVKKVGGKVLNDFITALRLRYGLLTKEKTAKGESFLIIKQTLLDGHLVGYMQDQARTGSPRLPFFGKSAKTNVSMAAIWAKQPAPVIPSMARRIAPRQHEIDFLPELKLVSTENADEDILTNAGIMNRVTEQIILKNPDQYLWLHKRWK